MIGNQPKLSIAEQQVKSLKTESRGTVPFLTRRAKEIKIVLGSDSIVDGFINFPIYTYLQFGLPSP